MLTDDTAFNMRECFRLEDYEMKMVKHFIKIGAFRRADKAAEASDRYRANAIAWASK